jgi:hypothetical protein
MSSIEDLIGFLKKIEDLDIPDTENVINGIIDPDLMGQIQEAAARVLIDDSGKNRWDNHEILQTCGYYVFAGERDRFGWLTGCIRTKKGIIVYD